jgi:hypothetical protein
MPTVVALWVIFFKTVKEIIYYWLLIGQFNNIQESLESSLQVDWFIWPWRRNSSSGFDRYVEAINNPVGQLVMKTKTQQEWSNMFVISVDWQMETQDKHTDQIFIMVNPCASTNIHL